MGCPAEVQLEDITNPVFHGVTISTTLNPVETTPADAPEGTEVTFAGAYSPMFIGMERKNLLYLGADNTLYYPDGAMTIGSCRAHFRLEGILAGDPAEQASLVRAFVLNFGDETTSIQDSPFTIILMLTPMTGTTCRGAVSAASRHRRASISMAAKQPW